MVLRLEIDDDVVEALRLPLPEVEAELQKELAFALYARWALPMGKARKIACLTKREFIRNLADRSIERHYAETDMVEDTEYGIAGLQ